MGIHKNVGIKPAPPTKNSVRNRMELNPSFCGEQSAAKRQPCGTIINTTRQSPQPQSRPPKELPLGEYEGTPTVG
jgi:hypothetical protein